MTNVTILRYILHCFLRFLSAGAANRTDGAGLFNITLEIGSAKQKETLTLREIFELLNLSQHVLCAGGAGGQRAVLPLQTRPVPSPGQLQALRG